MTMDMVTAAAAWTAILVSGLAIVVAGRQAHRLTRMTLADAFAGRQSENVIHFTDRYLDLIRDEMGMDDEHWRRELWGLLSTEFYFFSKGWLPTFIFQLWMVELARTYNEHSTVRESHVQYLSQFDVAYPEMVRFFREMQTIAAQKDTRVPGQGFDHRAVVQLVAATAPRLSA